MRAFQKQYFLYLKSDELEHGCEDTDLQVVYERWYKSGTYMPPLYFLRNNQRLSKLVRQLAGLGSVRLLEMMLAGSKYSTRNRKPSRLVDTVSGVQRSTLRLTGHYKSPTVGMTQRSAGNKLSSFVHFQVIGNEQNKC